MRTSNNIGTDIARPSRDVRRKMSGGVINPPLECTSDTAVRQRTIAYYGDFTREASAYDVRHRIPLYFDEH
jgi:hypothetical protein